MLCLQNQIPILCLWPTTAALPGAQASKQKIGKTKVWLAVAAGETGNVGPNQGQFETYLFQRGDQCHWQSVARGVRGEQFELT